MSANASRPHRRSIRLRGYDYTLGGGYFVSVCTESRMCLFGQVSDGKVALSDAGRVAWDCWQASPEHYPGVTLDAFVVMPNHIHGILALSGQGVGHEARYQHVPAGSLGSILRSYKAIVTRTIRQERGDPTVEVWQRGYMEQIIRNGRQWDAVGAYIVRNPAQWEQDEMYAQ